MKSKLYEIIEDCNQRVRKTPLKRYPKLRLFLDGKKRLEAGGKNFEHLLN